ncbi:hypothetical protein [Nocardia wallacei]|uniref:hypothetical protein n=1 Tax=Nocardia wallacei TaxID=480035 RepID=UPI002453D330|nr:hypothetical protein [Nocardia wallacei]
MTADSRRAIGLVCQPLAESITAAPKSLRHLAEKHDLEVVEVVTYWPKQERWILSLLETINRHRTVTVVVSGLNHVGDGRAAIVGAADLISPTVTHQYIGYSIPEVRP